MYTPEFSKPRVLSVSQLNFYIKSIIENDARLNFVFVTGEISNLTDHYRSGHIYLSIKDEKSVIRAVMFAGNARNLKFRPTDGMKVICRGRVAVYEPTGQYQLYIEDMQPDGIGALNLAYEREKLLKKLEKLPQVPEGYVDGQYSYLYAKLAYIYYVEKQYAQAERYYQQYLTMKDSHTPDGKMYSIP